MQTRTRVRRGDTPLRGHREQKKDRRKLDIHLKREEEREKSSARPASMQITLCGIPRGGENKTRRVKSGKHDDVKSKYLSDLPFPIRGSVTANVPFFE